MTDIILSVCKTFMLLSQFIEYRREHGSRDEHTGKGKLYSI